MESLIGQGRTADVFRYGENKVIKVFHQEFTKLAYEEYSTAQNIASVGIPAPDVYDLMDVENKKGIVYEYIQGTTMVRLIQKNPFKVVRYAKQLADLHAEINSKPVSSLTNIKESIVATIRNVLSIKQADREAIICYLKTLPDGERLCHYDFHPGNVLISDGNAKAIDWMTAGAGNPCADVCRTGVILNSNALPPNVSVIEKIMANALRKIFYANYFTHYCKITDVKPEEVEQWLLPVAAARLAEGIESEVVYLNGIIKRKMSEYGLN
jgi:uncharacterized protein (TIGR02172 family)